MSKSSYKVKRLVTDDGERMPIMINNGELHYYANSYALTNLRMRNRASHTVENALRAIIIALQFFDNEKIDLERRLIGGSFLTRLELEGLNRFCRLSKSTIDALPVPIEMQRTKVVQFNPLLRKVSSGNAIEVTRQTASLRQVYIRDYLLWMLEWFPHSKASGRESFEWAKDMTKRVLSSFSPVGRRGGATARLGLSQESQQELFRVISHSAPDNPWESPFCRVRNELLIKVLFYLGIRRGELLALQVSDLNFAKNKILIARRPDNPEDPRRYQPLVKTLPRRSPLENVLAERLYEYIHTHRRQALYAKNHPFLFVSSIGHPLSLSALSHVCLAIKARSPKLLGDFSAHQLRRTWNDRFSQIAKDEGITPAREQQIRCRMMGWVPHSQMSDVYSKRYIQEEAQRVSLKMQQDAASMRRAND